MSYYLRPYEIVFQSSKRMSSACNSSLVFESSSMLSDESIPASDLIKLAPESKVADDHTRDGSSMCETPQNNLIPWAYNATRFSYETWPSWKSVVATRFSYETWPSWKSVDATRFSYETWPSWKSVDATRFSYETWPSWQSVKMSISKLVPGHFRPYPGYFRPYPGYFRP